MVFAMNIHIEVGNLELEKYKPKVSFFEMKHATATSIIQMLTI